MSVSVELIPKDMDKPADKPSEKASEESGSKKSQIEAALGALRKRKEDAPKEAKNTSTPDDKSEVERAPSERSSEKVAGKGVKFDSKMLSAARQLLLDK